VRVADTDEDAETPRLMQIAVLEGVPVMTQAGGGCIAYMPLADGDPVLVLFCEQDPTLWLETGDVSDPADWTRHGLHPMCMPGGRPTPKLFSGLTADAMIVGKVDGLRMKIDDSLLSLGTDGGTLDFVALAQKVDAMGSALKSGIAAVDARITAHVHVTTCPAGAGTSAPTVVGPATPPVLQSTAASKVKAQ
jgi:Phage protein Gp138 N-terminal domain